MSLFGDLLAQTNSSSNQTSSTNNQTNSSGTQQPDPLMTPIVVSESKAIVTEKMEYAEPAAPIVILDEPPSVTAVEATDSIIFDPSSSQVTEEVVPSGSSEKIALSEPSSEATTHENKPSDDDWSDEIMNSINETDSPLFEMMTSDTKEEVIPKMDFSEVNETSQNISFLNEGVTNESSVTFRDTAEYITHAIEEVSGLIASIDSTVDAKVTERDEYKTQKENFAAMELKAEEEHQRMIVERSHAKKMKTYLEHELAKTTTPAANDEKFALAA